MCVCVVCVSMNVYAQNVAVFFLVTAHLSLTSLSLGSRALASCTLGSGEGFHFTMLFEWKRKRTISSNEHKQHEETVRRKRGGRRRHLIQTTNQAL